MSTQTTQSGFCYWHAYEKEWIPIILILARNERLALSWNIVAKYEESTVLDLHSTPQGSSSPSKRSIRLKIAKLQWVITNSKLMLSSELMLECWARSRGLKVLHSNHISKPRMLHRLTIHRSKHKALRHHFWFISTGGRSWATRLWHMHSYHEIQKSELETSSRKIYPLNCIAQCAKSNSDSPSGLQWISQSWTRSWCLQWLPITPIFGNGNADYWKG